MWSDEQNINQLWPKLWSWPNTHCLFPSRAAGLGYFFILFFWRHHCLSSSCDWHFNNMLLLALVCHFLATLHRVSTYLTPTFYFQMADINKDFKSIFSRCKACKICHNICDAAFISVCSHHVPSQSYTLYQTVFQTAHFTVPFGKPKWGKQCLNCLAEQFVRLWASAQC